METTLLVIIAILNFIVVGLLRKKTFSVSAKVDLNTFLDKGKDCTTIHLPPIGSSICNHQWKQVSSSILKAIHEEKAVIVLECTKCGLLDKTIETTSPVPKSLPVLPCNHQWEEIANNVLEMDHEKRLNVILKCKNCGSLDKTESVTGKIPREFMPALPKSECKHSWKLEKQLTLPSAYEQIVDMAKLATQSRSKSRPDAPDIDHEKLSPWMFRKTYLVERICTDCGEINTTIASNIEEQKALT